MRRGFTASCASRRRSARRGASISIQLNQVVDVEESQEGVLAGFKEAGLVEGRDYIDDRAQRAGRHGDGQRAHRRRALASTPICIVTFSTPTLQAALQRARSVPIVFTYVSSAVAAGAGTSDTDHLPNVTGVYMLPSYDEMLADDPPHRAGGEGRRHAVRAGGVNSVFNRDLLDAACRKAGLTLEAVPANTSVDVADAGLALAARRPDVICQIPGNLTAAAFPTLQQAAAARAAARSSRSRPARPTAAPSSRWRGTTTTPDASRPRWPCASCAASGPRASRSRPSNRTRLIVNLSAASQLGLTIPADLVSRADEAIGR